jgi:prepilin-type N-terminal cleavage/methylation domain-containing protein/prepilin-type processing-associated H-X9-DG protein
MKTTRKMLKPQRGGFTLIELLVVITIIGILASLILPGVQNVRAAARKTECLNNMRNVGLAMISYASANGQLPPLTQKSGGVTIAVVDDGSIRRAAPWTVMLFPYLDQQGMYDRLVADPPVVTAGESITTLLANRIPVFNCPVNVKRDDPGAITFVVNGGYMASDWWDNADNTSVDVSGNHTNNHSAGGYDWPFEGNAGVVTSAEQQVTKATGLFFRRDGVALDAIRDGTSQTIMLSENVDTRTRSSGGGWSSYALGDLSFGLRVTAIVDSSVPPLGTVADWSTDSAGVGRAAGTKANALELNGFNLNASAASRNSKINGAVGAMSEGRAPRPSSYHPQGVNALFADGAGKFLSGSIDDSVYARLISSNGNAHGQAVLSGY